MRADTLKALIRDTYLQGYAGALADLHRLHGADVEVTDTLNEAGLTIEDLRKARAASEDLAQLQKAMQL